jgi:hypothetical protein
MKRVIGFPVMLLLTLVLLAGCAAGTKGVMVSSYELAGVSLTTAKNAVKPVCDAQQLPAAKCDQIKKIYNDARSAYLLAGDSLVLAIETDDLVKRQAALSEYQALAATFTSNTTAIINLLVELGVIKKPVVTTAPVAAPAKK